MRYIEELSKYSYILHINVKTNSKKQGVIDTGEFLTIQVLAKPIKNKANIELIRFLKNKLDIASDQIKILKGLKSSNKSIQIDFLEKTEKQSIIRKLRS
ncbi:MAG: DUF167 domain-containing protein [Candidatus Thorarchaeota archaeon]